MRAFGRYSGVLGFNYYAGISEKLKRFFEEQASVLLDEFWPWVGAKV